MLNLPTSLAATFLTGPRGVMTKPAATQPEKLLRLYEFENCPYCRLVRLVLTELDIDALIYPCPKNGKRFRAAAKEIGGKAQFPLLVDQNTDQIIYESKDIIAYLYKTYAKRRQPLWQRRLFAQPGAMFASIVRGSGMYAKPSKELPSDYRPLELWSFESSPYARPVRDRLCELELPYILHSAGRVTARDFVPDPMRFSADPRYQGTTRNRAALKARAGRVQIPYLHDPNTGKAMFESQDIIDYIDEFYGADA